MISCGLISFWDSLLVFLLHHRGAFATSLAFLDRLLFFRAVFFFSVPFDLVCVRVSFDLMDRSELSEEQIDEYPR